MAQLPWEKLPPDALEKCNHVSVRWQGKEILSDRCEKRATMINRSTCFCGSCDMTYRLCAEHAAEHLAAARKHGVAEPGLE